MNITNINNYTIRDWNEIFTLQTKINEKFEDTYKEKCKNFDISYYKDQEFFKHYCWCITEELCESLEALEDVKDDHLKEELIDALNFTIQLYVLYGWNYNKLKDIKIDDTSNFNIKELILKVIYQLGMTANCLKNRIWRESQYLVDLYIFEDRFKNIWKYMIEIFYNLNISDMEIRKLWDLKYQVNLFRIESKY